jgi:hypothetical protein
MGGGIKIDEAVEEIGGTLIEMVEIDEVDYIVESVYDELLGEGYDEDDIEEALEYALTEAKVTFGHDTPTGEKKRGNLVKAVGRLARQKLSSKIRGAKASAKAAVARGARKVAKGALGVARKIEGGDKTPKTAERKPSTYRGAGAGTKEKVSSGSYTAPTKKKVEKPADPWEGTTTTPPKAKAKKAATPKAKSPAAPKRKRKSKLDDLLASIRSEEYQIDEKLDMEETEMGDVIKDFQTSDAPQFKGKSKEKRREMAIAAKLTAERGGKKLGEDLVTEKDEKIEAKFKGARTPFLLDKFRKEHPGSRQEKKKRGAKETPKERQSRLTNRQVERAVKYGLTKKEKGETQGREKYYSSRD